MPSARKDTISANGTFVSQRSLNVFVSSKMNEFAQERQALHALIPSLLTGIIGLRAWAFEKDAAASELHSREIWLEKLDESDVYIGIFGRWYGQWTIDEFKKANDIGLLKLIFIKNILPEQREQQLTDFLTQISDVNTGLTPQYFETIQDLERRVTVAIANWMWERLTNRSRRTLLETLKKCNEEYLAWFDRNEKLADNEGDVLFRSLQNPQGLGLLRSSSPAGIKDEAEHRRIIRKAIQACEDAEDAVEDDGKRCLEVDALSADWDSCYSKYKHNLTYIARRRLVPYFVTGHSASEGPANKAGAEKMGPYHQRNLNALRDAIDRLETLLRNI